MKYAARMMFEALAIAVGTVLAIILAAYAVGLVMSETRAKSEPACITTADPGQHATPFKEIP